MVVTIVGIRDLKTHLSKYMREVKAGHEVIVTERGRPIGRIVPEKPTVKEKMLALREAGFLEWNGERLKPRTPTVQLSGDKTAAELLLEDRE